MRPNLKNALFLIAACAISTGASAHIGIENHGHAGFWAGFWHPIGGADHMAAMLSVGLWTALVARQAGTDLIWGPLVFVAVLLQGALLGMQGVTLPAMEPMIAVSLVALGLLVITRMRMPVAAAGALVGAFALFHGLAHGNELAGSMQAIETLAGMACATVAFHMLGLGLGWLLRSVNVWLPRTAGTAVALFGGSLLLQLA